MKQQKNVIFSDRLELDNTSDINLLDYSSYDLIISDDNRDTPKTNLKYIYQKKNCIMVGCYHGAGEKWNNFKFVESTYEKY